MGFFETMALLELADRKNSKQSDEMPTGIAIPIFLLLVLFLFALPVALILEFRKKKYLFMLGIIIAFFINEAIAYRITRELIPSLFISNFVFGIEYILYLSMKWISRKIINEDKPSKIGIFPYIVLFFNFLTFEIYCKLIIGNTIPIGYIFLLGLIPALLLITIMRSWFIKRFAEGKNPVPKFLSVLFIPAFLSPWILVHFIPVH